MSDAVQRGQFRILTRIFAFQINQYLSRIIGRPRVAHLYAPVLSTSARTPRSAARSGPTRRRRLSAQGPVLKRSVHSHDWGRTTGSLRRTSPHTAAILVPRAGHAPRHRQHLVTATIYTARATRASTASRQPRSVASRPTPGTCTTCTAKSWSGARTGRASAPRGAQECYYGYSLGYIRPGRVMRGWCCYHQPWPCRATDRLRVAPGNRGNLLANPYQLPGGRVRRGRRLLRVSGLTPSSPA
jgi:hypothetical protein